jgi:hypothetical protein
VYNLINVKFNVKYAKIHRHNVLNVLKKLKEKIIFLYVMNVHLNFLGIQKKKNVKVKNLLKQNLKLLNLKFLYIFFQKK